MLDNLEGEIGAEKKGLFLLRVWELNTRHIGLTLQGHHKGRRCGVFDKDYSFELLTFRPYMDNLKWYFSKYYKQSPEQADVRFLQEHVLEALDLFYNDWKKAKKEIEGEQNNG